MKNWMIEAKKTIKRLFEANAKLEHYWFLPKISMVPVKVNNSASKSFSTNSTNE